MHMNTPKGKQHRFLLFNQIDILSPLIWIFHLCVLTLFQLFPFYFFHFFNDVSAHLLVPTCQGFFLSNCCSCSNPCNIKESPHSCLTPLVVAPSIPLSPQMVQPLSPLWFKNHLNPVPSPFTATITSFQRTQMRFYFSLFLVNFME